MTKQLTLGPQFAFCYFESDESRTVDKGSCELRRIRAVIRKMKTGKYRLYSRKKDPKTGKRRNLGTFDTREQAEKHERAVQFFKRHG